MSRFVYLLSEGVHDIAFLTRVLSQVHGGKKVSQKSKLDVPRQRWIDGFKWPLGEDINRLSVPAPKFVHVAASDTLIGLRNAEGIDRLKDTLEDDLDTLDRHDGLPDAIGVFLDSDKEPQATRYTKLRSKLQQVSVGARTLTLSETLAAVSAAEPRVGVYAFPEPGKEGALEDLLLDLGRVPYAALCDRAREYVSASHADVASDGHSDWKELKGQSGVKKATFATATAILRPGRGTAATIEDNRWICDATRDHGALTPCLAFLSALLAAPQAVA